jgi:hypothetical protein
MDRKFIVLNLVHLLKNSAAPKSAMPAGEIPNPIHSIHNLKTANYWLSGNGVRFMVCAKSQ